MDTRAINSAEIPNMQNAIEAYTVAVEDCIQKIKAFTIGTESGLYGTDQVIKVNNYIFSTCEEINKIVRHFDEFKQKLAEVAAAYVEQSGAITTGEVAAAKANEGDLVTVNRMS